MAGRLPRIKTILRLRELHGATCHLLQTHRCRGGIRKDAATPMTKQWITLNGNIAYAWHYATEEPRFYPCCDEVDLSDEYCPNCDHQLFTRTCGDCGGEGGHDGYEDDPLWYNQGEMIPCGICRGHGFHHWCPRCGWDMLLPKKWNRPEHRGMAIARPL